MLHTRISQIAIKTKHYGLVVWGFVRSHKIISILGAIVCIPIILLIFWIVSPEKQEMITALVEKKDVIQTVEAVGDVISEKDLQLKFPVTGVVAEIYVTEGDVVVSGQEIARLRNDSVAADVSLASARLSRESASLKELRQGTRPEDILIAEAQLTNKKASLEAAKTTLAGAEEKLVTARAKLERLKEEADTSLSGLIAISQSAVSHQTTVAKAAIRQVEDTLETNTVIQVIAIHDQAKHALIERQMREAEQLLNQVESRASTGFTDYRSALDTLNTARVAILKSADAVSAAFDLISGLPLGGNFDRSEKESQKSTIATETKNARDALSDIDTATKNLRDAAASFDTKIATEENTVASAESTRETALADIRTFETAVITSEAELSRKRAGARPTEISAAQARVNEAYAEFQRAEARLEDTILRAPFDGTITKVDMKLGEFSGGLDSAGRSVSMLGASPYRIEMYIAEIDIPKVTLGQTGIVELDAFPRTEIELKVSEIDTVATEVDGVSKYRTKLDFVDPPEGLKIGMSGDSEIQTGKVDDVLTIPGRAVSRQGDEEVVRVIKDGEITERKIMTGLDGSDGELEIVYGLEEGEEVVVLIRD